MHENLKTTFSLEENAGLQTVSASQAYGTFFTLHCKFEYHEGSKTPKKCHLHLQNYTGAITIGLVSVNKEIRLIHDPLMKKPSYVMYVHLKGLHAKESIIQEELKFKNDLEGHNVDGFSVDYNFKIEFIFEKIEGFNSDDLKSSKIIDSGYLRDGENILKKRYSNLDVEIEKLRLYKNYFNSEDVKIQGDIESVNGIKTSVLRTSLSNCIETVIVDGNDDKPYDVVPPYPCYNSYVKFV